MEWVKPDCRACLWRKRGQDSPAELRATLSPVRFARKIRAIACQFQRFPKNCELNSLHSRLCGGTRGIRTLGTVLEPVRGHTCATCKGFCYNNMRPENWLKGAEGQDSSSFMTWRKANGQRFSGRRKYESVSYFPNQKRLADTACVPSSRRSNYSPPMPDKKPYFSLPTRSTSSKPVSDQLPSSRHPLASRLALCTELDPPCRNLRAIRFSVA
jgi:hypothetical protein